MKQTLTFAKQTIRVPTMTKTVAAAFNPVSRTFVTYRPVSAPRVQSIMPIHSRFFGSKHHFLISILAT
jgi:hypothetical protein